MTHRLVKTPAPARHWDSAARSYVEHDTTAQETFGVLPAAVSTPAMWLDLPDNDNDRGPYISTYTGRFYMFDPRPEDWCIADVSHALANICRYTGAGANRYSVAEHSVHVYRWLTAQGYTPAVRLAGLMHDAVEALSGFGDVARPAKNLAPIIKETEENIWRKAISPALNLPGEMPADVHEADMRICADEMSANMHEVDPNVGPPLGVTLEYWEPVRAEAEFLRAFHSVQLKVQGRRMAA